MELGDCYGDQSQRDGHFLVFEDLTDARGD